MEERHHRSLGLSDQDVLEMYRYMLLARKIDERLWLLNRAGKIPFVVSCQGQEAAQIGAAFALDRGVDYLLPYYRDMGMMLVFGQTARDLMLAAFAKADDPNSGGRQMPGHYGDRRFRILSGSSPVATQVPHATGVALALKMEKQRAVVFTSLGEGSTNQGDFHEACNFAGVHQLPVIIFCQNNRYAISVPIEKQIAGGSVAARAKAYGFPGISVDGNDPLAVYEVVKTAVERARNGGGPTLIEAHVHRQLPHSSDDDHYSYRSREELENVKADDPLLLFARYLRDVQLLTEAKEREMEESIRQQVDEATQYAEQAADPDPDSLFDYVYGE